MTEPFAISDTEPIAALVREICRRIDEQYPRRIDSVYLTGSYVDGTSVSVSDLDVVLVLRDAVTTDDEVAARGIERQCASPGVIPVDLTLVSERELQGEPVAENNLVRLTLRFASHLVAGGDIRAAIRLPDPAAYVRWVTRAPLINSVGVIRNQATARYPLTYPDPDGEFYGYDVLRTENRYSPTGRGTKDLVAAICWTATARVALETGEYIARKSDSLRRYRAVVNDDWTDWIEAVVGLCRIDWNYLIPDQPADQAQLRELCQPMLAFENQYLERYRDYLLEELASGDEMAMIDTMRRLEEIVYPDRVIGAAINDVIAHAHGKLRAAAEAAQARWHEVIEM